MDKFVIMICILVSSSIIEMPVPVVPVEETVRERVLRVINDELYGWYYLDNTTRFSKDLYMDEVDKYEVLLRIENEFDVEYSTYQEETIKTIGDIIDYINKERIKNENGKKSK